MSLAVLRDVTKNHFPNGILTTHGKIQCQSATMLIPAVTVESAASQLLELAPREYTGAAGIRYSRNNKECHPECES